MQQRITFCNYSTIPFHFSLFLINPFKVPDGFIRLCAPTPFPSQQISLSSNEVHRPESLESVQVLSLIPHIHLINTFYCLHLQDNHQSDISNYLHLHHPGLSKPQSSLAQTNTKTASVFFLISSFPIVNFPLRGQMDCFFKRNSQILSVSSQVFHMGPIILRAKF